VTKVIQIRGVPDDVHRRLVEAAEAEGKSLTAFLADELSSIARRADLVWHNRQVIGQLGAELHTARGTREDTLRALDEGRAERGKQLTRRRRKA
jgi:hypothetical protein